MIEHLNSDNLLFKGLNEKPRTINAVQASDQITKMTIEQPVSDWKKTLNTLDIQQHSDRTFGAIVLLTFKLILPNFAADYFLP